VEVEAELGVNADAEVVVHDEDGRRVLVRLSGVGVVGQRHLHLVRLLLVGMKYHRPPNNNTINIRK